MWCACDGPTRPHALISRNYIAPRTLQLHAAPGINEVGGEVFVAVLAQVRR